MIRGTQVAPLSPVQKKKGEKKKIQRRNSKDVLGLVVGKNWDVSEELRRNSLIFRRSGSGRDLLGLSENDFRMENPTLEELAKGSLLEAVYAGPEWGWKLVDVKDHVWVYLKPMDGTSTAFKCEMTLDYSPDQLGSFLISNLPNWMDESAGWLEKHQVIEETEDASGRSRIFYNSFYGTPQTRSRDYVILGSSGETETGSLLWCECSIEHNDYPPVPGKIRGEMLCRGYVVLPIIASSEEYKSSLLAMVVQYNPKGDDVSEEKKEFIAKQGISSLKWLEKSLQKKLPQTQMEGPMMRKRVY